MKGQILSYSVQENTGILAGADNVRYAFKGAEWKEHRLPSRGLFVDFDVEGKNAVGIYLGLDDNRPDSEGARYRPAKSKVAAILWAVFLGSFGAHKFYMGSWGWGVVYLLTFWTYIPSIVSIVEFIRYLLIPDDDFYMKAEQFKNKGAFGFFW